MRNMPRLTHGKLICLAGLLVLLLNARITSGSCTEAALLSPPPNTTTGANRPAIEWTPVAGAGLYRVQIQSRVPEGKVLATLDTKTTAPRFTPPQTLTDHRAVVKVRVTVDCQDDAPPALALNNAARFHIDTSPLCVMPDEVETTETDGRLAIKWKSLPDISFYVVSLFSALDGKLLTRLETPANQALVSDAPSGLVVVSLRPFCKTGYGAGVYKLVAVTSK